MSERVSSTAVSILFQGQTRQTNPGLNVVKYHPPPSHIYLKNIKLKRVFAITQLKTIKEEKVFVTQFSM
jgi:hypothetical protein